MKKRIFSILLAVFMVVSMVPMGAFSVFAAEETYVDRTWDAEAKKVVDTEKSIPTAESITADTTELGSGWYVVDGDVTVDGRINITGTAANPTRIILKDGCTLTVLDGLHLPPSRVLYVYGQSEDSGTLNAQNRSQSQAPIGGDRYESMGSLTVCGGNVNAAYTEVTNVYYYLAAGIGGGMGESGGNFTIYGGNVSACGQFGAGIGGGLDGNGGNFTMYAGNVEARGDIASGIGAGGYIYSDSEPCSSGEFNVYCDVWIRSGKQTSPVTTTVEDYLEKRGTYIWIQPHTHDFNSGIFVDNKDGTHSEKCKVCDWTTNPTSHDFSAGVFKSNNAVTHLEKCALCDAYGNPTNHDFTSGVFKSNGLETHSQKCTKCDLYGNSTPHIYTQGYQCDVCGEIQTYIDRSWDKESKEVVDTVKTIPASAIVVKSDTTTWEAGKWYYVNSDVTISSLITVNGTDENPTNLILKDGCTLNASAGISVTQSHALRVYGQHEDNGTVVSTSGYGSAGIGGTWFHYGSNTAGGNLTVYGGIVKASTGIFGAGIGSGKDYSGGNFTIYGGKVEAASGGNGAGIGGGYGGTFESFNMYGGVVTAYTENNSSAAIGHGSGNGDDGALNVYCDALVYAGADEATALRTTVDGYETSRDMYVRIVAHTHSFQDNVCECGDESYISRAWDNEKKKVVETENTIPADAISLADAPILEAGKWYYAEGSWTSFGDLDVEGTTANPAHLILKDNCSVTIPYGVYIGEGKALCIYGQSKDSGTLTVPCEETDAIGVAGSSSTKAGSLTVYGGTITATSEQKTAITCGVTIYGGNLTATTGSSLSARGISGSFLMYGGKVTAKGGTWVNGIAITNFQVKCPVVLKADTVAPGILKTVEEYKNGTEFSYVSITEHRTHDFTGAYKDNDDGTHSRKCTGCEEYSEAVAHTFGAYVSNNDMTCTEDGTKTRVCSACGLEDTITDTDTKLGHTFEGAYRDNHDGTHSRKCTRCDVYSEAVAHTFTDGVCPCGLAVITYVSRSWDSEIKKVVSEEKYISKPTMMTSTTTTLDGGWYYVSGDVEIEDRIIVNGTKDNPTRIILRDGCNLTASQGIQLSESNVLEIYGQTADTGSIMATGGEFGAGIGGGFVGSKGGCLNVYGGVVTANGGWRGAGIGGGSEANGGTVTVYGGSVTANGGEEGGAGIGGGARVDSQKGNGGDFTMYGGVVTAIGSTGAGVGGGFNGAGGNFTMYGGTVTAWGDYAPAIGAFSPDLEQGNITLNGDFTITGGDEAPGEVLPEEDYLYLSKHLCYVNITDHIHTFTDYVCGCGAVDLAGCKTDAIAAINAAKRAVVATIADKAIEDITNATTVDEVKTIKETALEAMAKDYSKLSLSVNGVIDVNIKLDLLCYGKADKVSVKFIYNASKTYTVSQTEVTKTVDELTEENGLYVYKISQVPAQIAEDIQVEIMVDGEVVATKTVSAKKYCDLMISNSEDENLVNFCKSMMLYAQECQTYFDYKSNTEGYKVITEDKYGTIGDVAITDAGFSANAPAGVTLKGVTFMALQDSAVRFYYTGTVGEVTSDKFNVRKGNNDTYTYIEVYGIEAANLDEVFTVSIDGVAAITGSALSYVKIALASGNDALASLAKAVAYYNAMADAYYGA